MRYPAHFPFDLRCQSGIYIYIIYIYIYIYFIYSMSHVSCGDIVQHGTITHRVTYIDSPGPFYRMGCYFSLWCHINNVYLTLVWEMWDAALDSGSVNKVYQMFA